MGLERLMTMQQRQRKLRRRTQARDGSIATVPQRMDTHSFCLEDDHLDGSKRSRYSGPNLPEEIWCHIHSLLPLQDAARSACASRTFLRSWRSYPKLTLCKKTMCLKRNARGREEFTRCFTTRVDHILKNHSGIGVKTLELEIPDYCNVNACHINRWLQIAIAPGIEEVTLFVPSNSKTEYNFPCSLLFDGRGNSIRYICLMDCAIRPSVGFDCLRSLTKLYLYEVRITVDELGCLISKSFALEQLRLGACCELTCLKIPFCLERLSCLSVFDCYMLLVIESKAPNLSTFKFSGHPVHLSLGESSQMKYLTIGFSGKPNCVNYAITKLPSTVPNLETLIITSASEMVNTPMVADKFLSLKYLNIFLGCDFEAFSPAYDYLSLVCQDDMKHDSVFGDASHLRQISGHKHDRLKKVQINGFCSAKSMVELTCHILENATSLETLTIDTIYDWEADGSISRCCVRKYNDTSRVMVLEAHKALTAFKRYILGRVPSTVKLNVGELCSRCHAIDVKLS
ncbi:hypothetical protein ACP70R_010449 [Stipagrostis hirtigluma subsp. patula]